jgi:hypothetical protein
MMDDYPNLKVMPLIEELPSNLQGLQGHMEDNWHAVVKMVDTVKGNAACNNQYETEITRLSNKMDQHQALST